MLTAILVACALLVVGAALRAWLPGMSRIAMPASVLGGVAGLAAAELLVAVAPPAAAEGAQPGALMESVRGIQGVLREWPGPLVALIFAGLLLERRERSGRALARGVMQAGTMVWIIVLGQVFLGLVATSLVIGPATGAPIYFGQLMEIGFAGGHGTAAALGAVFDDAGRFAAGRDLAMFMATAGLVYGIASGVLFVNIGRRRGWARRAVDGTRPDASSRPSRDGRAAAAPEEGTRAVRTERASLAPRTPRLPAESIDPLAFQCALLGIAFGIGWLLREGTIALGAALFDAAPAAAIGKIPLFLFALLGGLVLRAALRSLGASHLVDGIAIRRLMGVAMEFLIVAALASLRLEVVVEHAWGLLLLVGLAAAWTACCLFLLSPRLLPRGCWFELGVLNYGMSTGTTAQGMMLLRMVDPELESDAAEDYALAAPLSAPFIGGGALTVALPFILERVGAGAVIVAVGGLLGAALLGASLLARGAAGSRR
ncbi:MAG TPA: hypothetical protein PKC43_10360 [Phycisphaerales bacterium]|nr:hypothetical protein [Phycisphaerales bacterium]HMP37839.1 hypothetical protein [Phycisphaerales bacterium]